MEFAANGIRSYTNKARANGIRSYTNKVRLRGLNILQPATAGFVCVDAVLTAQLTTNGIRSEWNSQLHKQSPPARTKYLTTRDGGFCLCRCGFNRPIDSGASYQYYKQSQHNQS